MREKRNRQFVRRSLFLNNNRIHLRSIWRCCRTACSTIVSFIRCRDQTLIVTKGSVLRLLLQRIPINMRRMQVQKNRANSTVQHESCSTSSFGICYHSTKTPIIACEFPSNAPPLRPYFTHVRPYLIIEQNKQGKDERRMGKQRANAAGHGMSTSTGEFLFNFFECKQSRTRRRGRGDFTVHWATGEVELDPPTKPTDKQK